MSTLTLQTRAICKNLVACALGLSLLGQAHLLKAQPATPQAKTPAEIAAEQAKHLTNIQRAAENVVRGTSPFDAAGKKALEDFVTEYFKQMFLPNNAFAARDRIKNFLAGTARAKPEIRAAVVDRIFTLAGFVVNKNDASPAARVNSIWMIADLDQTAASNNPPVPYADATKYLYVAAKNGALPSYIRSVALYGLERHARILGGKWSDALKNAIALECGKIVNSQPSNNLDVAGHAWMVRRAFDVLTVLKSPLADKVAIERLADTKTLPSIRLASAKYLSNIDLSNDTLQTDLKKTIFLATLQLTHQECSGWIKQQQDQARLQAGGSSMGGAMGMPGGMESGGMGGYGGDSTMGGGMPGDGASAGMGGYGMDGGMGGGMPGMEGGGMGMPGMGIKPIDQQSWETRLARRKINVYFQICHQILFGAPLGELKDAKKPAAAPATKSTAKTGGLVNGNFRTALAEQAEYLILLEEAFDNFQAALNDRTLTEIGSLQTRLSVPSTKLKLEIEKVPGYEKYLPPKKPRPGEEDPNSLAEVGGIPQAVVPTVGTGTPPTKTAQPAAKQPLTKAAPAGQPPIAKQPGQPAKAGATGPGTAVGNVPNNAGPAASAAPKGNSSATGPAGAVTQ